MAPEPPQDVPVVDEAVPEKKTLIASNMAEPKNESAVPAAKTSNATMLGLGLLLTIAACAIAMTAQLGSIVSSTNAAASEPAQITINTGAGGSSMVSDATGEYVADDGSQVPDDLPPAGRSGENTCAGAKLKFDNTDCIVNGMTAVGPQAGANVTKGYQGDMQVDYAPITDPYYKKGLCPVNVHWHLGAEHLSVGEYDENGDGPQIEQVDGGIRQGHQCTSFDAEDPKFTRPYQWKYCKFMEVGQTYEVHWPHSAVGACGTPNQYQTPFYDGVFCNLDMETFTTLTPSQIASNVGVQAQVFVVVNDESYFWPDLMRGMIVDGEMGSDVAKYTGSTTGDARSNERCSPYSPITWQVDRKCHMISASSFDKLCYDMLQQRDDMSGDVFPHGSRETVADELAANNHANRFLRTQE
ncbi:hypothetical protein ACHAXT_007064 [Thalassiosira profunda]